MPLKLKYTSHGDYLKVEILGKRTPGNEVVESKEIWKEISALVKQEKKTRILAMMKVEGRLPINSAFQIAESAISISSFAISESVSARYISSSPSLVKVMGSVSMDFLASPLHPARLKNIQNDNKKQRCLDKRVKDVVPKVILYSRFAGFEHEVKAYGDKRKAEPLPGAKKT